MDRINKDSDSDSDLALFGSVNSYRVYVVTPKDICRTGRVHVHFRCWRLCEHVFTAL